MNMFMYITLGWVGILARWAYDVTVGHVITFNVYIPYVCLFIHVITNTAARPPAVA